MNILVAYQVCLKDSPLPSMQRQILDFPRLPDTEDELQSLEEGMKNLAQGPLDERNSGKEITSLKILALSRLSWI